MNNVELSNSNHYFSQLNDILMIELFKSYNENSIQNELDTQKNRLFNELERLIRNYELNKSPDDISRKKEVKLLKTNLHNEIQKFVGLFKRKLNSFMGMWFSDDNKRSILKQLEIIENNATEFTNDFDFEKKANLTPAST